MATARAGGGLATLLILSGGAMVSGVAGTAAAVDGQTVQVGDEVWTGPDGIALLTFFDGSETQLQPGTHVKLEVPDGLSPGTGVSIFQSSGTTLNHVQHLAPNASFQTDTPTAVAMVRGTTYVVTAMRASAVTGDGPDVASADATPASQETTDPPVQDVPAGAPADDQADQQAAAFASAPLADGGSSQCARDKPTECVASVLLLADADGHVGHVEVASHIVGYPTLHLITHGDSAHVSQAGAQHRVVPAEHLTKLHDAARHLHDVRLALKAHVAARHILRAGAHRTPPTAPKSNP
jgi:hypothetical protein